MLGIVERPRTRAVVLGLIRRNHVQAGVFVQGKWVVISYDLSCAHCLAVFTGI